MNTIGTLMTVRIGRSYLDYVIRFAGVAEIEDIAVMDARRQGTGRRLVNDMIARLPPDVVTVFAFCRTANTAARGFYAALRFEEVANVPAFYKDEDKGVVMVVRRLLK